MLRIFELALVCSRPGRGICGRYAAESQMSFSPLSRPIEYKHETAIIQNIVSTSNP